MSSFLRKSIYQDIVIVAVFGLCSLALWLIPSPQFLEKQEGTLVSAQVLETDESALMLHGLVKFGTQKLQVKILEGKYKDKLFFAANELRAQMELDKEFKAGDVIQVVLPEGNLEHFEGMITAKDYDRSFWTNTLFGLFCVLLCLFGGWTGAKALFSFLLSAIVMWKAVIPLTLRGWPASWTIFACICFLTAAIIFLVAGFTRKGFSAFLGSIAGVLAGLVMAHWFAEILQINGAVLPYAQTLLFSGFPNLNLQDLFVGAMMLASSGAVMDLGMDISSGVEEVSLHSPGLSRRLLTASGLRIGKSVVGTMTTTLLLAYSGGYISLLMMFSSQGTSISEILNNPLVASETVKTLIGSFSLVLVAPFTAVFAGFLFGTPGGQTLLPPASPLEITSKFKITKPVMRYGVEADAEKIHREGLVRYVRNRGLNELRPAVFLDRDGTLIFNRHYLKDPAGVCIIPGVIPALKKYRADGCLLIMVSNQSGIGRGYFTLDDLESVHNRMIEMFRAEGIEFDACYYCPHTPDESCSCRKPGTGMIAQACQDFSIDLGHSLMVGDSEADKNLALAAGVDFRCIENECW